VREDRGEETPRTDVGSEDTAAETVADDEWPVPPDYRAPAPAAPTAATPETAAESPNEPVVVSGPPPAPPARRLPPTVVPGLVGLALLLLIGGIVLAFALRGDGEEEASAVPTGTRSTTTAPTETTNDTGTTPSPARVVVPDVVGMSLANARSALERERLEARVRRAESERPQGEVVSQDPEAEREASARSTVVLVVSSGQEQAAVPDVVGRSRSEAVSTLREAGFRVSTSMRESSEPAGTVLQQAPRAGSRVVRASTVRITVAKEPEQALVRVPRVVGLPVADARARLRQAGLRSTVTRVESSRETGTVVRQDPGAGASLREGQAVELEVSGGPAKVSVPDVVGLDAAAARQAIQAAGLAVEVIEQQTDDPSQDGVVITQTPRAGASVEEGAVVTITVGAARPADGS
jgi:beta-lactam-binding protein with PASTA domain